jgi:predicted kinase
VLSGLPGTGKTTIARALAARLGALHLRIDSVEAALKASVLRIHPAEDAGYRAALAVARDNLALGHDVIGDAVNPLALTRGWWREVAEAAGARLVNVEIVCSDRAEHRRRVEARRPDLPGLALPDWARVTARDYEPWTTPPLVIDTARTTAEDAAARIAEAVRGEQADR